MSNKLSVKKKSIIEKIIANSKSEKIRKPKVPYKREVLCEDKSIVPVRNRKGNDV